MNAPRRRRAAPLLLVPLCAVVAVGLTGCGATNLVSSGKVKNLSDLPNKDQSMVKLGDIARGSGDCAAAVRFYRLALDGHDDDHDGLAAHLGIGGCDVIMGNLAEARTEYDAAAKIAPDDPNPALGLGRIRLIQHDPGGAATFFDLAITKGANDPFVWNDKGVAYDQLRRHKEAQDAYRSGLTAYPNDRALRNNLALSYAMSGNLPEAESLLRVLVQEPDASPRTRQNLALVLGLKGDTAAARELAGGDLDNAALDNNARFYDYARATMNGTSLPPPGASAARGGAPLPPPVLVDVQRAESNRAADLARERHFELVKTELAKAEGKLPEAAPVPPPEPVLAAPTDPAPPPAAETAVVPAAPPVPAAATPAARPALAPPTPLVANSETGDGHPPPPLREMARATPLASAQGAGTPGVGPVASSENR